MPHPVAIALHADGICCNDGSGYCTQDTPVCVPNSQTCCKALSAPCGDGCIPKGANCCGSDGKYCDAGFKCVAGNKCQQGSAAGIQAKLATVTALVAAVVMLLSML